jgi:WD40 repeat protein
MSESLPTSPYKGLTPYADSAIDAMLFFGRERDAEIVCANVVASRLTVLYGSSGVGKSSLLAAAVARRLRALPERPVVVVCSAWSESPTAAIARAVAAEAGVEPVGALALVVERACEARGDVYVLLDQVEEYFLYHPAGGDLEEELAAVLSGSPRANILLALREDALAELDRFKASIPAILDNYLRLDRLSRGSGRAAIVQPLARWRELGGAPMEIEPALVEAVLDQVAAGRIRAGLGGSGRVGGDANEETVEAPYLQLVMDRLWEVEREQGSSTLRAATLERLGGAAQIVAAHLERAMDALAPPQKEIASELLRQLVTPSGAKISHGASDLAGYAGVPEAEARGVLDVLAARRILRPGDDGRYEIYHDVLAGPILGWRARYVHAQALVDAHRRSRRLALVAMAAVAGLVITALIAVFALVQRGNARSEARDAHARELDAAAVAVLPTDPELGLLLARDSAVLSPTATAEEVLRQALGASRVRGVVEVGRPLLVAAAIRGSIVAATADGVVVVTSAGSKRTVATGEPAVDATISEGGDVLMTGRDGRLRLVSGLTARLVPNTAAARGANVSVDSSRAAVWSADSQVRLVDLRSGDVLLEVDHGASTTAAALSVGGRLLATGGVDRVVRIWRTSDGRLLHVLKGHVGPITAIAFSARGTLLATASTDGVGRVWHTGTGQPVTVLSGHANFLTDISFSPDGTQVATASTDRTARTWKAETGAALATFAGDTEAVVSARFTRSGHELLTASLDGSARTWDAVVQPELSVVAELDAPVTRVDFVHSGRALEATAGESAYRIGLPRGPAVRVGAATAVPETVAGPGGLRAAVSGRVVTITRRDGTTIELTGHRDRVTSVAFSADGTRVVTASADHDARIWDAGSGALLQVLLGHFAIVSDARFSADGRWVVTAGPGTAGLWRASSGRLIYLLQGHKGKLLSVAFAPDGRRIATGGQDGTVRLFGCTMCGGTSELVALADARLAGTGRVATEEERARFGL